MPLPSETLLRMKLSPVPTQTTFGSEGAIAMAPIDWAGWSSKIGFQWIAAVGRLPDAARGGADVVGVRIAGDADHGADAVAGRADEAIRERRVGIGRLTVRRRSRRRGGGFAEGGFWAASTPPGRTDSTRIATSTMDRKRGVRTRDRPPGRDSIRTAAGRRGEYHLCRDRDRGGGSGRAGDSHLRRAARRDDARSCSSRVPSGPGPRSW